MERIVLHRAAYEEWNQVRDILIAGGYSIIRDKKNTDYEDIIDSRGKLIGEAYRNHQSVGVEIKTTDDCLDKRLIEIGKEKGIIMDMEVRS